MEFELPKKEERKLTLKRPNVADIKECRRKYLELESIDKNNLEELNLKTIALTEWAIKVVCPELTEEELNKMDGEDYIKLSEEAIDLVSGAKFRKSAKN